MTAPTVALVDGTQINTALGSGPASLTIHTNNLNLGDGSNSNSTYIYGKGVTIDDNGGMVFSSTGLTITGTANTAEYVQSFGAPLVINATRRTSSLLFTGMAHTSGNFVLDGDNGSGTFGVALTANNQITVDNSIYVNNQNSQGNWVLTAPTVQLNDGANLDSTNGSGPASLAIHTNNLNIGSSTDLFANSAYIHGNGVVIDDNGGMVFSTTGLTITAAHSGNSEFIRSSGSSLVINATAGTASSLLLTSIGELGAEFNLEADSGVTLTANSQVQFDQNVAVRAGGYAGAWTLTAPTVALASGASFNVEFVGNAPMTIHTNNLNIGDANGSASISAGGITIDDANVSLPGLAITAGVGGASSLNANGGTLNINATASANSSLLITSPGQAGTTLNLDGNSVAFNANGTFTVDKNMLVGNTTSSGNWTVSATAAFVNSGASINLANGAGISFTVSSASGITQAYPQGLDLRQPIPP